MRRNASRSARLACAGLRRMADWRRAAAAAATAAPLAAVPGLDCRLSPRMRSQGLLGAGR